MKKVDVSDYSFAHLTLTMSLQYLVKCRSRILAVYNSECILVAHASGQNIIASPQNHWKSAVARLTTSCGVCIASESIVPSSRTLTNWNDASTANGPLCVTRAIERVVGKWRQRLRACVRPVIKMMWCDTCEIFWDSNCQSCLSLFS